MASLVVPCVCCKFDVTSAQHFVYNKQAYIFSLKSLLQSQKSYFEKTVTEVCCLSVQVENFTVAFSDGRVLCYLIHHYHPSLLPDEAVSHSTTQTVECSPRGRLELNCSSGDSDNSFDSFPTGLIGTWQLCAVSIVQLSVWMHPLKKIFMWMFIHHLHSTLTSVVHQSVENREFDKMSLRHLGHKT